MSQPTNPSPEDRVKYRDRAKKHARDARIAIESAETEFATGNWDSAEVAAQLAASQALVSIAYSQMAPPMRVRPQHCTAPGLMTR